MRPTLRVVALFSLALLHGCSKSEQSGPAIHPAKGVLTRDGKPVGALFQVDFKPAEKGSDVTITGVTNEQGVFELGTTGASGNRKTGAPEGTYEVTVMTPMDEKQSGGALVKLPQKVTIKPGSNDLRIDLPAKK